MALVCESIRSEAPGVGDNPGVGLLMAESCGDRWSPGDGLVTRGPGGLVSPVSPLTKMLSRC